MTEETEADTARKLVLKVERREKELADLKAGSKDSQLKIEATQAELEKTEGDKKKAEDKAKKLEKRMNSGAGRASRLASDGVGSIVSQVFNFGEQALLDYLISAFPDSIGKYKVIAKSVPGVLSLVWYLGEVITLKGTGTLPKQMRLTAANLLANLNFVYMGQAFSSDMDVKKNQGAKLGQSLEEANATNEQLNADLEKARKLLKDKGVEFKSDSNG